MQRRHSLFLALTGLLLLASIAAQVQATGRNSISSTASSAQAISTVAAVPTDPRLVAGTYLGGGSTDYGRAVGLDAQGNIYVAGDSFSSSMLGQALSDNGSTDIVVAKLSPDGKHLLGLFSIGSPTSDLRRGRHAARNSATHVASVGARSPHRWIHEKITLPRRADAGLLARRPSGDSEQRAAHVAPRQTG